MKILFLLLIKLIFLNIFTSASKNFTLIDSNISSYSIEDFSTPLKSNLTWFYHRTFTVIPNIIEGQKPNYLNSLTLALHISNDRNFGGFKDRFENWKGPISIGIYMVNNKVLSQETKCTICDIKLYIKGRRNIAVHFIFKHTNVSDDDINYLKEASFCNQVNLKNDKDRCIKVESKDKLNKLVSYPINTIRNVARRLAQSKFLIVTDSDIMFSPDFTKKVLPLVKKEYSKNKKTAFVMRIFETVSENYKAGPKNKKELHEMLKKQKAFVFHHQNIIFLGTPKLTEWFKVIDNGKSSIQFEVPYDNDVWEPKLIIPDDAPYHDENFVYPYRDNTVMRWSLCMEGYKFLVLNNVFVYHLGTKSSKEMQLMREARTMNSEKYINARKDFIERNKVKYPKKVDICMRPPDHEQRKKLLSDNIFEKKNTKKSKKV